MSSQSRKHRGYATERSVALFLSQWWGGATVQRGNGKDVVNVPFDCEVKSRSTFAPREWLKQATKRASVHRELAFVVCRMNGQSDKQEVVPEYLAFMRFGDLVELLLRAGYGDLQTDSVQLEPTYCQCGNTIMKGSPCHICEKLNNASL